MQGKLIILSSILFILSGCSGQEKKQPVSESIASNKKLLVSFTLNDSTININDRFNLWFANGIDTLHASIKGNELILPDFREKKDTGYTVGFECSGYKLYFSRITRRMIFPGQDVEWKFGIQNKALTNNYRGLLSEQEYKSGKKYKEIQFLQFNPLEEGDGVQFVNKIE